MLVGTRTLMKTTLLGLRKVPKHYKELLLQRVAACCSVLQRVAPSETLQKQHYRVSVLCQSTIRSCCCSVLQRVAACCSVLQRVAACCSGLQRVELIKALHKCPSLQQHDDELLHRCVAACCSVLQRVAPSETLQRVAV